MTTQTKRVAIIQAQPVYYDLAQTIDKAQTLIHEAAAKGAKLITFGETWFSGYPVWLDNCTDVALWDHEPTKKMYQQLVDSSLSIQSEAFAQLQQTAQQLEVTLVLSINERVENQAGHGSIFNSLLFINEQGDLVNHHRKLVPTHTERLVWSQGDGQGLKAINSQVGRVGGLICWEHWMPLARQTMHNTGEQIHVAVWPTVNDLHQLASQHYAIEGRCFVLAAGSILRADALQTELAFAPDLKIEPHTLLQRGGSAIIAPNGEYVIEPVYDEEQIIVADLDLNQCKAEQLTLDVTGHYSRPDIFDLTVNRKRYF